MSSTGGELAARSKILMVANWDWILYRFRLDLACMLRERGHRVVMVCPEGSYVEALRSRGLRWRPWNVSRRGLNPIRELGALRRLAFVVREEQPALMHLNALKPSLYGSLGLRFGDLVGRRSRRPAVVSSLMGLGYIFSTHARAAALRRVLVPLMRWAFGASDRPMVMTFSNEADRSRLVKMRIIDDSRTKVILSECVDIEVFRPGAVQDSESDRPKVLVAARLLWDKGIGDLADAAWMLQSGLLSKSHPEFETWIAGAPDRGAVGAVPEERLRAWTRRDASLKWLGHCSDMPKLLREVAVAVLPTKYGEGVPRFLIEAAAAGLPLIATDIPSCREVVRDGVNGILVPPGDSEALAEAIARLLRDPELRRKLGEESRRIAVARFGLSRSLESWLSLYVQLLRGDGRSL